MSSNVEEFSQRLHQAHNNYIELTKEVHTAAEEAHQDVTHKLEVALLSLSKVVSEVHASYKEDGSLDQNRLDVLESMKNDFASAENAVVSRAKELDEVHEKVATLESGTIYPLQKEAQELVDSTRQELEKADSRVQELEKQIPESEAQLRSNEEAVDQASRVIDDPVIRTVAGMGDWNPLFRFSSLMAGLANGEDDPGKSPSARLQEAQDQLNNCRIENERLRRGIGEAGQEAVGLRSKSEQASALLRDVEPLLPRMKTLVDRAARFKGILIHIKGKATKLTSEASEVAGSISVTAQSAYTKEDFAFGILSICDVAMFDIVVKDELEKIVDALVSVWTIDGQLTLRKRLKEKLDAVQSKIRNFQTIDQDTDWDKELNGVNNEE